jgi:hypothetical protein
MQADKRQTQTYLLKEKYPLCCKIITEKVLQHLAEQAGAIELFPDTLAETVPEQQLPEYLPELARPF